MKTLFASLFAALFALSTVAAHAAIQPKDGGVAADEEKTDGDKAPTTDTEKKDATAPQGDASSGGTTAAGDEDKTDGDKAPTTDTEKKDDEDKDKDGKKSD